MSKREAELNVETGVDEKMRKRSATVDVDRMTDKQFLVESMQSARSQ